jgi:hypothetical protein
MSLDVRVMINCWCCDVMLTVMDESLTYRASLLLLFFTSCVTGTPIVCTLFTNTL